MLERLIERGALSFAAYTAVDPDPSHKSAASARLEAWAASRGLGWGPSGPDRFRVAGGRVAIDLRWVQGSIFDEGALPDAQDLLLAHAFLDLVDLDRALPRLVRVLRPGGLLYLSHNFDGLTAFLPEIDRALDATIVGEYHATMDERRDADLPSGDSRTGRRLLTELPRHGVEILAAGASDWIVVPRAGRYAPDEGVFLQAMIDFVGSSLAGRPALQAADLEAWIARRRAQVVAGELTFLAHQIDILGRIPG